MFAEMFAATPRAPDVRRLTAGIAVVFTLLAVTLVPGTSRPVSSISNDITALDVAPGIVIDDAVVRSIAASGVAEVIVQVTPAAEVEARGVVVGTGGDVRLTLPIVDGFSARLTSGGLRGLAVLDGVLGVSLDGAVAIAHDVALGEANGDATYAATIGADVVQAAGHDGSGVGIAVVDTGVSPVADLAGRLVGGVDLTEEADGVDSHGHGTFIAGIAAGDGSASGGDFVGVAPGAHVIPVKIASRNGASDVSHVLAAIQYVVSFKDEHGIRVMNLSLGTDSTQPNALSPLNYAVQRAWDAGIVVIVSAGNHGAEGAGRIPKPADDPLVITVGATDSNGTATTSDDVVAPYSSRGPSIADGVQKPDLVAPGSHLIGPKSPGSYVDVEYPHARIRDDYLRGSGTSYAAGVVSGAVALLLDAHPSWTPDEVKGALLSTAAAGPAGDPNVDGAGFIDLAAAVALSNPPAANVGVARGTGLGSLAADRGSNDIEIMSDPVAQAIDLLVGAQTAQGLLFDAVAYTSTDWNGSNWYGSNWYGSNWYGSNWYGSNWYGSNWYGFHRW